MNYRKIIRSAAGRTPVDLVIKNVTMLIVTTCEWIRGDIAVSDGIIVGYGPESYEGTKVFDGTGLFAVPGFIDCHVHVESSHALPFVFEDAVLPRGTTTAICDPHELANVCGLDGIKFFLDCAEKMRLDLTVKLSSCVPSSPMETSGARLEAEDLEKLKYLPHAGGLAELMNVPGLLAEDASVLAKLEAFSDRPTDGHAPFLSGKDLNAYCSCGINNDHECSTNEEALDRIRRGMTVLIREGSAARNARALAKVITRETVDYTCLCTDDKSLDTILECGHIDDVIRVLIASGAEPELVYRAASLSAARSFSLNDRGMLAPGKIADVVLLDDVRNCRIRAVFKRGLNAAELEPLTDIPDHSFALNSIRRKKITPDELKIFSYEASTPVIELIPNDLTTKKLFIDLPIDGKGEKRGTTERDVLKICVIARHGVNENVGKGFVRGFGMKSGALASSVGHDSHNVCVVGTDDEDMALAVNALIECGGGYAVAKDGRLLAKAEFPVGGLMSEKSAPELAAELKKVNDAVRETQCRLEAPFMQLSFLTLPVIPFLKITDKGVYDTELGAFAKI